MTAKSRVIAIEEHYLLPSYVDAVRARPVGSADLDHEILCCILDDPRAKHLNEQLRDVGEARLATMDAAGIDVAVLSHVAPGVQIFDAETATSLATDLNDELAELIARHPTRFAGLGVFAPQDAKRAAKEIERAMLRLKLSGLVVNSHTNGEYLDDPKFWPALEAAEACGAPIYIHPRNPPTEYRKLLEDHAGRKLLTDGLWGFQLETSLHALRLMVSGVLDRFPRLKIVLGHMGEGIPYWLYRLDFMYPRNVWGPGAAKRLPSEYFRDNFVVTTSGLLDHPLCHPTLAFCHSVVGPDHVLFASDFPFQNCREAAECIRSAPLSAQDIEKIAHTNTERLFPNLP